MSIPLHPSTTNTHTTTTPHNNTPLLLLSPRSETYTSLIQQYLSLLCYQNATFLAERFVAYERNNHSLYLLAMCYYRSHEPKRARYILRGMVFSKGGVYKSSRYLLAKCCLDLGFYGEAEEALFSCSSSSGGVGVGGRRKKGQDEDEWFLSEPCPIPNGAAGLHLLGVICRKSNRKRQAAQYFRLSLKLDPLMWTSFEYLCEMGFPECDVDPVSTFGVIPSAFQLPSSSPLTIPLPNHTHNNNSNNNDQQNHHPSSSPSAHCTTGLIMSPHHTLTPMVLNERDTTTTNNTPLHFSTPTHLKQHHPSARVKQPIFDTPNLTPIQRPPPSTIAPRHNNNNTHRHSSIGSANPPHVFLHAMGINNAPGSTASSSAASSAYVLTRAKKVASRLYYDPSPESCWNGGRASMEGGRASSIGGEGGGRSASMRLSFSSHVTDVPPELQAAAPGTPSKTTPSRSNATPRDNSSHSMSLANRALFRGSYSSHKRESYDGAVFVGGGRESLALTPLGEMSGSDDVNTTAATTEERKDCDDDDDDDEEETKTENNNNNNNNNNDTTSQQQQPLTEILTLLCTIATSYKLLTQYHLDESITLFSTLPPRQFQTGFVLHHVGRAHFERGDYPAARRILSEMHQVEPHRLSGLEVLSTALWHLKKEVELCHLAQQVVDFDKLNPAAWCVVGNCFSLQKEHEVAIQFFRRSVQLDPGFTYSHTLSGHEYVSNEDFDRAVGCYRDALRSDERHYNAWYGLGAIYFRQEKFDLAEYHFRRAIEINPRSSVLFCHLGMAQHANSKPYEALQTLEKAFQLDERNAQARYQRASIYITLDRPRDALGELEKVRDSAPREASVHFSMGKVYKKLGDTEKAMRCFLTALDLDPKDNNMIKASMDRLEEPDVEEDVSAF